MSTLTLKANSRGSWANVCEFPSDELAYVQAGAEGIVKAAGGRVAFKVTDPAGTTLCSLDTRKASAWIGSPPVMSRSEPIEHKEN